MEKLEKIFILLICILLIGCMYIALVGTGYKSFVNNSLLELRQKVEVLESRYK